MPFNKVADPINGGEVEIFEGYVDFVSIKEKARPDQYGKTHRVSVCVDGEGGKGGTWLSFPAITESRIRGEGMAISVQSDNQWYELCKGFKIRIVVVRNGDFINVKIGTLKVLEVADLPEVKGGKGKGDSKGNTKPKSNYSPKKDDTGLKTGHALRGAASLYPRFKDTHSFDELSDIVEDLTDDLVDYYSRDNKLDFDDYEVNVTCGMAMNCAIDMVDNVGDLGAKAKVILDTKVPRKRDRIKSKKAEAERPKQQPKQEEKTEDIDFDDDIPF